MQHLRRAIFVFAAVLAFAGLLPKGADALTVSPPTFDYSLNPGDTVLDVVKIYNEGTEPITIYPILQNFTANDQEGGEPLMYPADQDPYGSALAPWIKVDAQPITIEGNGRANIPFAINVPRENVQPGGHYGAVMLSTLPPDQQGGMVSIGQQIGVLILVRISGEVKEIGSIAEFGFMKPKVWYNYLPVDFFARFENGGNTHLRPVGNLFIKDWMGRQVASIQVNSDFKGVLPKSIRKFTFGWQRSEVGQDWSELKKEWKNFALGKYTATLVLNYGSPDNQRVIVDEREFTVWPWRLILIFLGAALFVILLFILLMKAYNHAVIRQYERSKAKEAKKP